jgi:hypothetical protein
MCIKISSSVNAGFAEVQLTFVTLCSDEAGFVEGEADHYRRPPARVRFAGAAYIDSDATKEGQPRIIPGLAFFCVSHQ